jgi:hypothetical protein
MSQVKRSHIIASHVKIDTWWCVPFLQYMIHLHSNNCTTLDSITYKHVVIQLHVSAFFGHPHASTQQRKYNNDYLCHGCVKVE